MANFEILEHMADVGFRARGATGAEVFATAARAMMAIAAGATAVAAEQRCDLDVTGHDYESLMVNWLEEILYLFDSGRFVASEFVVDSVSPERLRAHLTGEPREASRHPWKVIVKAVTYHQIEVAQRDGGWQATVYLDV